MSVQDILDQLGWDMTAGQLNLAIMGAVGVGVVIGIVAVILAATYNSRR